MHQRQCKFRNWLLMVLVMTLVISACVPAVVETSADPPQPTSDVAAAAKAQTVAAAFLLNWQEENYLGMYDALSSLSQDLIDLDDFEAAYRRAANSMNLQSLTFQLLSGIATENHAEVAYRVEYLTLLVGSLSREMVMNLTREQDTWRVSWEPALIFPDLEGGNRLEFVHKIPSRGRIFDRDGAPLAAYESAVALGIVPGEILPEQAELVYETLAEISFYEPDSLARLVESTPDDWYLPVVSLTQDVVTPYIETLRGFNGVRIDEFRSRFYLDSGIAPHALGYMLFIPEEELDTYLRLGYRQDERIGATGLEAAFEAELSGKRGGSLYLVGPNGNILSLLASSEPEAGQSIYTTIDKTLQMRLQQSLGDLRGAVVVTEADTGRVLALVSNPHFDPNAFDMTEIDRSLLESYFSDPDQPLFNRATQGQYPLGSVFKIVSMAAALEAELYPVNSTFYCGHSLRVCDSVTLFDWTLAYGVSASGVLTLQQGLMRSCNPWFYRIGEGLYSEGLEDALSKMAFSFGLGARTGIDVPEAPGNIPETAGTCVNNAQIAIGQGEVLVTPLQVVRFFGALANGGTLYRPALVETITPASGEPVFEFSPDPEGALPISDESFNLIVEGLRLVVEDEGGTAYYAMRGLDVPVSGKTGTAETPTGRSHAWFAGYSRQSDPQRPDIAVAVILENSGEGSQMAAPVFRRVISLYFSNYEDHGILMPWEAEPYVPKDLTPLPTEITPTDG